MTNPTVSRQSAELYKTFESLKSLTYLLRIKWVFQVVDLFLYLSQFRSWKRSSYIHPQIHKCILARFKTRLLHIFLLPKQRHSVRCYFVFACLEISLAGIWMHGLCVSAMWLYQLSYEDPFIIPYQLTYPLGTTPVSGHPWEFKFLWS